MKLWQIIWKLARPVLAVLLFGAGYAAGNLLPAPLSSSREQPPLAKTSAFRKPSPREELRRLVAQTGGTLRRLLERRDALARQAKETSIAWDVLRARGGEDPEMCRRLAERRLRLEGEARDLDSRIEEAARIEERLRQLADRLTTGPEQGEIGTTSMREARALLLRMGSVDIRLPILPDDEAAAGTDVRRR